MRASPPGRHRSEPRAPWRWAAFGLLAGLGLALIQLAPARWLQELVAQGGRLQLIDPSGTIWSGSARLLLLAGPGSRDRALLPGRLQWHLQWGGGGLQARVQALCCMSEPMQWTLSLKGGAPSLSLADHRSVWPAAPLSGLGTPLNTLRPDGSIHLQTRGLHWSGHWQGQASIEVRHLASALSPLKPMGSYRIDFHGGTEPLLKLSTLEGALQLQGQGRWQAGRLRFEGLASAAAGSEEQLETVLNILGRRQGRQSILSLG